MKRTAAVLQASFGAFVCAVEAGHGGLVRLAGTQQQLPRTKTRACCIRHGPVSSHSLPLLPMQANGGPGDPPIAVVQPTIKLSYSTSSMQQDPGPSRGGGAAAGRPGAEAGGDNRRPRLDLPRLETGGDRA